MDKTDFITRDRARLETVVRERLERDIALIESIPAGLGTRRFHRLTFATGEPRTLIARIEDDAAAAPPRSPSEANAEAPLWLPEPSLEPLRTFLESAGLPVPRSFLHLEDAGLDLLEDVGDRTLLEVARASGSERVRDACYAEACGLIPRLQSLVADPREVPAFGRIYDRELVETKAWKWLEWTIPLLLERPATASERSATKTLFAHITRIATSAPMRLSHRDFKAENLHRVPVSPNAHRLVMIDVQGAFLAPPEYDLVCLLYDLQVDLTEEAIEHFFATTRPALPGAPDAEISRERFDALAIARVCKDVAHVVHAARIRGDARRLHEIPRGLELIRTAAERRARSFPGAPELISVTEALTAALRSADSPARG